MVGPKLEGGEFGWLWPGTSVSVPDTKWLDKSFTPENSDGAGPERCLAFGQKLEDGEFGRLWPGTLDRNFKAENSDGSGPEHRLAQARRVFFFSFSQQTKGSSTRQYRAGSAARYELLRTEFICVMLARLHKSRGGGGGGWGPICKHNAHAMGKLARPKKARGWGWGHPGQSHPNSPPSSVCPTILHTEC